MTATQRHRKQTKAKTKTARRPKAPSAKFWMERAARIAASREANEKTGLTERQRRALRKAERAGLPRPKFPKKGAATKTTAKPTATTKGKGAPAPVVARLRADTTSAAYRARVLKTITRSTKGARNVALVAPYIGADAGGGWIVRATDGHRALLERGTPAKDARVIARPFVTADGPRYHLDLANGDIERALRSVVAVTVRLTVDPKTKRVTVSATDAASSAPSVRGPVTGKLAALSLQVNRQYLLDGFGRGGQLRYEPKETSALIETADDLRYIVMGMGRTAPTAPQKTTTPKKATQPRATAGHRGQFAKATPPPIATPAPAASATPDPTPAAQS